MKTHENILEHITNYPIIPVYYNDDVNTCLEVLQQCYNGGIRVFEFTNRGKNALLNFQAMLQYKDQHLPGLLLGIGTIKSVNVAEQFINLGCDFLVSPIVKAELAQIALQYNKFWIPGCMTPTEINLAEELGATLIKLFPGDLLGPDFLKSIKPLFPSLKFMPTGGVDLKEENINNWLKAGVTALGLGSKLFTTFDEDGQQPDWLTKRCAYLNEVVRNFN
ncbi:MAG: bifunctional 4-hydroxy-2-oxoglutarate aldolase/2-dehydro-3-deoxy-phosphogluconate aldolase [Bacteroidota bacterium]